MDIFSQYTVCLTRRQLANFQIYYRSVVTYISLENLIFKLNYLKLLKDIK